jgi:hypothetical protein
VALSPESELRDLVERVDTIVEIPNSIRNGTEVRLGAISTGDHP